MKNNFFILLDALGNIPGYPPLVTGKKLPGHPIFFDRDIDRDKYAMTDDTFDSCRDENLELIVKHTKLNFDFYPAAGNSELEEFFVSQELFDIIRHSKTPPFRYKFVKFLGKNRKKVTNKTYYVITFHNITNYIQKELCEYVIPDGHEVYERNLVKAAINNDLLNQYDIVPSMLPTFPRSLIVNKKISESNLFKKMKFNKIPLEEAPTFLFTHENQNIYSLNELKRYTEKVLNKM